MLRTGRGDHVGASKKEQMRTLDDDWPDQIWSAVSAKNGGQGAAWRLAVAALAVTGARPAALEKGITFSFANHDGRDVIEAHIPGVKLTSVRGQPEHMFSWSLRSDTHRVLELDALAGAIADAPDQTLVVQYDAEAISTRLREVSKTIWPRRKNQVTGYCYRELLSSTAKAAGVPAEELAAALGHRSAESQGAYARAGRAERARGGGAKPWGSVAASVPVKMERAPMARFKAATAIKKAKLRRGI